MSKSRVRVAATRHLHIFVRAGAVAKGDANQSGRFPPEHGGAEARALEQENERLALQAIEEREEDEAACAQEIAELKSTVSELQKAKDELPGVEREERGVLDKERARVRTREREAARLSREVERRLEVGTAELNLYQDALGLKLEVVADACVRFSFICIDHGDPDKVFWATMSTSASGDFERKSAGDAFDAGAFTAFTAAGVRQVWLTSACV